jgi:hypothetical protein
MAKAVGGEELGKAPRFGGGMNDNETEKIDSDRSGQVEMMGVGGRNNQRNSNPYGHQF